MGADDMLADDPTPLPDELRVFIPRAMEILSLFNFGEHEAGHDVIAEYSMKDLRRIAAVLATMAAGLLNAAYSCTELPEEDWMPHFSAGLTGWFMSDE
jgi:hypothetical protein